MAVNGSLIPLLVKKNFPYLMKPTANMLSTELCPSWPSVQKHLEEKVKVKFK